MSSLDDSAGSGASREGPRRPVVKPFSEACERNKAPLLAVLGEALADAHEVLEIGSGTGQHAAYFAAHLPHLTWHPSDLAVNHPGIRAWTQEAALPNLAAPLALDVYDVGWPIARVDAAFSANTAHILAWAGVVSMFQGLGRVLAPGATFILYGPFRYGGEHTSPSNARFDRWLRGQNPASGIRDFEAVDALARAQGLQLVRDCPMPAHNRTLVWRRDRVPVSPGGEGEP